MFRATTDTRSFEWEAYGATEQEARDLLTGILDANTEFTPREVRVIVEDANVYPVRVGLALRDQQEIS